MQEHAGHANAMLREFRRKFDGEVDVEDKDDEAADQEDGGKEGAEKKSTGEGETEKKNKQKPHPSYWVRRVDDRARRQELRFWKRMAMPHVPEDDPMWSDDDDLIDPAEKRRLSEVERKVAEEALAGVLGSSEEHGSGSGGEDSDGEGEGSVIDHHQQQPPPVFAAPTPVSAVAGVVALGGVAMERDSSATSSTREMMPTPPPRPASTGSTGGRTG